MKWQASIMADVVNARRALTEQTDDYWTAHLETKKMLEDRIARNERILKEHFNIGPAEIAQYAASKRKIEKPGSDQPKSSPSDVAVNTLTDILLGSK